MASEVDAFFEETGKWKDEFRELRRIVSACGLSEELKWGKPCYAYQGKNVVLIHGFKEYCALLFHKGALLEDAEGILVQQTENVQAARQIRFTGIKEIKAMGKTIKAYVRAAIDVEKAGLKVELKQTSDYEMPAELRRRLDADRALKEAFEALTPGRQRGYIYHVSQAKQSATRAARVEKSVPKILEGLGFDE